VAPLDRLDLYNLKRGFERVNEALDVGAATADLRFLAHARAALLPLPVVDRPRPIDPHVFPPFRARPARALAGKRVAVIGSGGGGGCVALVGVVRAFEEAGVTPDLITACSGSAIWGSMWSAGMSAQEMAGFSLSWRPQDYLDIQWRRLPGFALSALRGFTGIAKGDAIQRLFDERLMERPIGEAAIPIETIAYNMDLGSTEYFGTTLTPELTYGQVVRIAIALPLFIESVRVRGHLYVDGGVVELFPGEPVIEGEFDHAFGLNFMLPEGFEAANITGWETRRGGILEASRQLDQGSQLEFARRVQRDLGDRLTLIDPIDHRLLRGVSFYDLFIDRTRWPELMRLGYDAATRALDAFRRPPRPRAARSRPRASAP